jgi:hypothetical protein
MSSRRLKIGFGVNIRWIGTEAEGFRFEIEEKVIVIAIIDAYAPCDHACRIELAWEHVEVRVDHSLARSSLLQAIHVDFLSLAICVVRNLEEAFVLLEKISFG